MKRGLFVLPKLEFMLYIGVLTWYFIVILKVEYCNIWISSWWNSINFSKKISCWFIWKCSILKWQNNSFIYHSWSISKMKSNWIRSYICNLQYMKWSAYCCKLCWWCCYSSFCVNSHKRTMLVIMPQQLMKYIPILQQLSRIGIE